MRFDRGWKASVVVLLSVALSAFFLAGCSDDDDDGGGVTLPQDGTVAVHFDHQVDGADLVVDITQFLYNNSAGNNYSVSVFKYFVSDLTLHNVDGSTYGVNGYHFRNAELADTRTWTLDGVPSGTYNAISFTFGLPADKNMDGAPISDDPNTSGMEWPGKWGGGWHYMILEGLYKESGTGTEYGYRTHTGRRMVNNTEGMPPGPDSFPYHHVFRVTLPLASSFSIDGGDWEVRAIMNLNGWYEDPQMDLETLFPQGTGGVMVNLSVQQQLQANGPACFSVTPAVKQ